MASMRLGRAVGSTVAGCSWLAAAAAAAAAAGGMACGAEAEASATWQQQQLQQLQLRKQVVAASGTKWNRSVKEDLLESEEAVSAVVKACEKIDAQPWTKSPFYDEALQATILKRHEQEKALAEYAEASMQRVADIMQKVENLRRADMEKEAMALFEKFKNQIEYETEVISYPGVEPGSRNKFVELYGCVGWTREALKAVKALGPIVEIGAGRGQWQAALTKAGADVVAYDNFSNVPRSTRPGLVGKVAKGDAQALKQHPDRTLLLVAPPYAGGASSGLACACLKLYKGDKLVYVGEGRGGVHASAKFFSELETYWQVDRIVPVKPFAHGHEKMYILSRRKA